ncbi:MAG: efflux RND transporter permease subunit [Verrucomicrobiota bacterium]
MSPSAPRSGHGVMGRVVAFFVDSKITPLLVVLSIVLGVVAVLGLPREEEPQINVTVIDLFVDLPAAPAAEVEQRVSRPLEKLMRELPGVEYVYSNTTENRSMVSLRFFVGYPAQKAIVEAHAKVNANLDLLPLGASKPLIKVKSIDDVPILTLTLWSDRQDLYMLRRLAVQLEEEIKGAEGVGETVIFGGQKREVRIHPDRAAMHAHRLMLVDLLYSLHQGNYPMSGGNLNLGDTEVRTDTLSAYRTVEDIGNTQTKNYDGTIIATPRAPIRLKDIARIVDGPGEPDQYVFHTFGRGHSAEAAETAPRSPGSLSPAVTLSVAKLPGTGASAVAGRVLERVDAQRGRLIPADVHLEITRNYGRTATDKSNELLFHMGIAVCSVTLLIGLFLGWRESLVVAVAIPVTLALTLSAFYFLGYTLNRITLFALIFSIGILVDDPIVDIENIVRHLRAESGRGRSLITIIIEAVNEVRSPLILATLAVMAAILPMALVRGLMGPYMRPIPVGASSAMFLSMMVAFVVTPWAAARILKKAGSQAGGHDEETRMTRLYRRAMTFLLGGRSHQWLFLGGVALLLVGAISFVPLGWVKVKMLPFDNKNEFQVILDMPEGTSLERTTAAAGEMAAAIAEFETVENVQVYAGLASPFNFNGLVRHYYLRKGASLADLQVNLTDRHHRKQQSHEIAKQIRERIRGIAERHHAKFKVAEVPPGPPVLETLVAEIYGPDEATRTRLAGKVETIFRETLGVVDVDNCRLYDQPKILFDVDREKASVYHLDPEMCAQNLNIGLNGRVVGVLHDPREREQVDIRLRLPESERSSVEDLLALPIRGRDHRFITLGEVVTPRKAITDQRIQHKNLLPVSYVIADVAGVIESPAYAIQAAADRIRALKPNDGPDQGVDVYFTRQPTTDSRLSLKWDGEMHVTYEVFRDLGLAFAGVLLLIYMLVVGWFNSHSTPLIIMAAIPFSLIGILPAHAAMGAFFSATSMIGFIAGAGIVVRNSIILVDFIQLKLSEGVPLQQAVIDAGAIRFRPMVLTAAAVVVGSAVILFDPIFQGLAVSLMAGEVASLLISRMAVPVLYFMVHGGGTSARVNPS